MKNIDDLERRLLIELVKYHFEFGVSEPAYLDPLTGGIYEHKLSARLDIRHPDPMHIGPPPEVVAAFSSLAEKGLVRRNRRKDDFAVLGVRPTQAGIALARFWGLPWYGKVVHWAKTNWTSWLLPILLTLIINFLLLRFGMK